MAVVDGGGSGGSPKKKPKKSKAPKPGSSSFIGPVIPKSTSSHPTKPTGSTKTPSSPVRTTANTSPSFIGPVVPAKPAYTPPPSYAKPPRPKKAPQIHNPSAFDPFKAEQLIPKSSNNLDDFLKGAQTGGRGISKPKLQAPELDIDSLLNPGNGSGFDAAKASGLTSPKPGDDNFMGPVIPEDKVPNSLEEFLGKIRPPRPEGYDPSYGGIVMPEKFKHRRGDKNAPLKQHWDQDYIESVMSEQTPGTSYAIGAMNDILKLQLSDQQQWAYKRTQQRALNVQNLLKGAAQDAYKGDFDTLAEKMELNPDYLEFNTYAQDYSKNGEKVWADWEAARAKITDPWMKINLSNRAKMYVKHYNQIRKYYNSARKITRQAVNSYEEKYNESVEFNDAEDTAGPAIPVLDSKAKERQEDADTVGDFGEDMITNLAGNFEGTGKQRRRKAVARTRQNIQRRLGVKDLPTVREMLAVKVSNGEIDPTDEEEVAAWIKRFQNPNHPDTRAMYYGFASTVNKKLDAEKDGLPFINGPIDRYINTQERVAKEDAAREKKKSDFEYDMENQDGFVEGTGDYLESTGRFMSQQAATPFRAGKALLTGGDVSEAATPDVNSTGAVGWTIDKLMRANYAVAGAVDTWNSIDNDPQRSTPWHENLAKGLNPMFWPGFMLGKDPFDSVDEIASNPRELGAPAKTAYEQFFRGSGFKGTSDKTVPTTFAHVIANNALRDSDDNLYDSNWYQNLVGFVFDAGTDPLNFVGIGMVDDTLKLPKALSKSVKDADKADAPARVSSDFLNDVLSGSRGPAADKAYRVQQAIARYGDESDFGVPTVADQKIIPFQFKVEYGTGSYLTRADEMPSINIPRFHEGFKVDRQAIERELAELDELKSAAANNVAIDNYREQLEHIGGKFVQVPDVRVSKVLARTSIPISSARKEGLNLDNVGGAFYRHVIKPLADADVIRAWPEHTSTTRFATDETGNLTTRAARAKSAMEAQERNYDAVNYYGSSSDLSPGLDESWQKAIDEGYDIDEVTGRPSVWEDYDVDSFIDAGAPGLLNGFDPRKVLAESSDDAELFYKTFSQEDVLRALWEGPRMLEESDDVARNLMIEARTRIRDAKTKLASSKTPSVREASYRALAMGYSLYSQNTVAGALRYLDTLRSTRANGAERAVSNVGVSAQAEHLDKIIAKAESELENSYGEVDDMAGYIGGFEGTAGAIPVQNGSYDDFDFAGKSWEQIVAEQGVENFSSRSKQMEAIIESAKAQRDSLRKTSDNVKVTALNPAEAYQVEQMLPSNSSFRGSDGAVDIDKVAAALKPDFTNDTVKYVLQKPSKPVQMTQEQFLASPAYGKYVREAAFLDNVANFVQSRANSLFRTEKSKVVRAKMVRSDDVKTADPEIDDFFINGKGPAERKLGPRPTKLSDRLPNYTERKQQRGDLRRNDLNAIVKDGQIQRYEDADDAVQVGYGEGLTPGARTKGQKEVAQNLERLKKNWDRDVARAKEFDKKNFDELVSSRQKVVDGFKLDKSELTSVRRNAYKRALDEAVQDINQGIVRQTPANTRLALEDQTKFLERQLNEQLKYEELQNKIARLEAETLEDLKAVNLRRKELVRKRIDMYGKIKRVKYETKIIRKTMVKRINEDQILQVANSPARMTGRMMQLRILGMKKNLQWSNNLFEGAEAASKLVPVKIRASFKDNFVRPTKQVNQQELIRLRARHESKTPVIIKDNLQRLSDSMAAIPEPYRKDMAHALEKDIPYGGRPGSGFEKVKHEIDDIMKIINGGHDNYVFKVPGKPKGDALSLYEIARFMPEGYAFDPGVVYRGAAMRNPDGAGSTVAHSDGLTEYGYKAVGTDEEWNQVYAGFNKWEADTSPTLKMIEAIRGYGGDPSVVNTTMSKEEASQYIDHLKKTNSKASATERSDPFSPLPDARTKFTYGDLLGAIRANGAAKDIDDPFRVAWVVRLAADQAAQRRSLMHSMGETFGVRLPEDQVKRRVVNRLSQPDLGWKSYKEVPNYLFPPEIDGEIKQFFKMLQPGPEQAELVKLFDQAMGYWKQGMTIYNPAYYTRNGIGEMMVSWLDGVNHPKWYRMAARVNKYIKKSDQDLADLVKKFDALDGTLPVDVAKANEVLFTLKGGQKVRIEDALYYYTEMGLKTTFANTDIGQGVRALANQGLHSGRMRNKVAAVNNKVHETGEGFEDWLRMSHFLHAMEKSGKGSLREAAEYAATRVERSHFDYTDFGKFEKTVMLRAFPFFKWIRRGAPLMVAHLFMTPGKMAALPKALNTNSNIGFDPLNIGTDDPVLSTQDVHEDKNGHLPNYSGIAPGWVRDLFAYAMQPNEDDEYANFFRITTPQIDGLAGVLGFAQNYEEKGIIGGLADTTAYPLLNPLIKSTVELGQNEGLDPDFKHQIYGGEFNENKGVSEGEAIGSYLARQASPHLAFLSKLSNRGKLPDALNVTDDDYEHGGNALRDVVSFFSGVGFYQGRQDPLPEPTNESKALESNEVSGPAVASYSLDQIPTFPGRARVENTDGEVPTPGLSLTGGLSKGSKTTTGSGWIPNKYGKNTSGWIPNKYGKKSGWIPNKYGKSSGRKWVDYGATGGSGGYGGYSGGSSGSSGAPASLDLLAILERLRRQIDQGTVIDTDGFTQ